MKRALVIALVALVGVTGCSGIPTGGSVNTGDVINDNVEAVPGYLPSDPQVGSSPENLLGDFMQAATSPQNGFEIARKYLANSIRDVWDPNAGVTIRSGIADIDVADGAGGVAASAIYSISSSASIDATGRYSADIDSTNDQDLELPFSFVKEDGEWRISELKDGIVLSSDNFDIVFGSYPLYFFDPSYAYLVPDNRWFPKTILVTARITDALLAGPSPWLSGIVLTAFLPGTTSANPVTVDSGVALVDLSNEARDTDVQARNRMRQQLKASFANVQTVTSVAISIGGVEIPATDSGDVQAIVQPSVNPLPLIRQDGSFGFATAASVSGASSIGTTVVQLDGKGATLAGSSAAVRTNAGVYSVAIDGTANLVDPRPGLIDPVIDSFGNIWSAQSSRAESIRVFDATGSAISFQVSSLDPSATIVSMSISRDGTRMLLYLSTEAGGTQLGVAGIARDGSLPTGLGEFSALPVGDGTPIDAAWVDSGNVAAMYGGATPGVTIYELGGPSASIGSVEAGISIASVGDGGVDNLRVLAADGVLYRPRGATWQSTDIRASFLGTDQPD